MEYIDKNKSREKAHKLIKEFLKECFDKQEDCSADLYSVLNGNFKNDLKNILLKDSDNRCCYCMRDLKGPTLEHVIPQKVKNKEEFDKYFEMDSRLDKENIILESEFIINPKETPPFPHTVAYENLIPSCFGTFASGSSKKSCNNYRGDKFIQPLIFRENIHNEIKYKIDGSIVWSEDRADVFPTVNILGLNCLELKAIRRIWYYLASHNLSCDESNKDRVINDIITITEPQEHGMLLNFKNKEYWNLLSQYTYFNNKKIFDKN